MTATGRPAPPDRTATTSNEATRSKPPRLTRTIRTHARSTPWPKTGTGEAGRVCGPYQQPSRPSQQVQAPRAARPSPPAHRSGGPAGNERLTAMTGTVLLILLAVGCPVHDHGRRHGRADQPAGGPARPTPPRLPPSPRPGRHGARRHGHRRLDPVHRGLPGDVPGASILITGVEGDPFGVGDLRANPDHRTPQAPLRAALQKVVGPDVKCGGEGVQVGVHEGLQARRWGREGRLRDCLADRAARRFRRR
jgi:hypothetical protein